MRALQASARQQCHRTTGEGFDVHAAVISSRNAAWPRSERSDKVSKLVEFDACEQRVPHLQEAFALLLLATYCLVAS